MKKIIVPFLLVMMFSSTVSASYVAGTFDHENQILEIGYDRTIASWTIGDNRPFAVQFNAGAGLKAYTEKYTPYKTGYEVWAETKTGNLTFRLTQSSTKWTPQSMTMFPVGEVGPLLRRDFSGTTFKIRYDF